MADNSPSPPPKPKPGSLRDRIAAFEHKAAPTPGPPPPRPKPAGFASWKPKPPSPPSSPQPAPSAGASGSAPESPARVASAGMNAADAKESITRAGGSLRERMAALQGRGAFGGAAPPPTAPKPAVQNKPKWKPPPQVAPVPALGGDDDDDVRDAKDADTGEGHPSTSPKPASLKSPPAIVRSPDSGAAAEVEEDEDAQVKEASPDAEDQGSGEKEVDEEEEERQRRAAIAARMAKLGGARFGMGPPVFGKPAVPLPSKKPSLPTPAPVQAEPEDEQKPVNEPTVSPDASPRPPTSMPAPAMPKRTAGPRRKSAKSISSPPGEGPVSPPAEPSISAEDVGSDAPKVDDVIAEAEKVPSQEQEAAIAPAPTAAVEEKEVHEEEEEEHPEEKQQVVEEEEDEETRKRRVAERLAKMGGINPMARPPRRPSVDDAPSGTVASPPPSPPISKSLRRSSTGHSSSISPPPLIKPASLKRTSVGSISSITSPPAIPSEASGRRGSVGSVEGVVSGSGRRASIGSARSVKREDVHEVSEIVEEPEEITESDPAVKQHVEAKEDIRSGSVVENDERDRDRGTVQQPDNYRDDHEVEDYSDDFDATPRPPARLPATSSYPSYATPSTSVPGHGLSTSTIPPPPGPPPPQPTVTSEAPQQQEQLSSSSPPAKRADKPLPPILAPSASSRDSSVERLSQPAIPRRLVPQTPEPESHKEFEDTGGESHTADLDVRDSHADDEYDDNDDDRQDKESLTLPTSSAPSGKGTRMLAVDVDDGEESEPALPVPLRVDRGAGGGGFGRGRGYVDTDEESNASSEVPLPVRVNLGGGVYHQMAPSSSAPPPPPPPPPLALPSEMREAPREESDSEYSAGLEDEGLGYDEEEEEEEDKLLRTRPLPSIPREEEGSVVVPTHQGSNVKHAPIRNVPPPPPPPPVQEVEVLDEDEGDPIDPSFHSPCRNDLDSPPHPKSPSSGSTSVATTTATTTNVARRPPVPTSVPSPAHASASAPVPENAQDEGAEDEDWEKKRRQNIAERMARLGAIQFGAPSPGRSPVGGTTRKVTSEHQPDDEGSHDEHPAESAREPVQSAQGGEDEDEEEERARRERIAAKLAGMGGMRIGMMPMGMPPKQSHALRGEPQQQQMTSAGMSESRISEEGVKVEAEEDSEIEEVGYEEAKGSEEGSGVEVPSPPPPPPPRTPRRQGTSASVSSIPSPPRSAGRPPVPMTGQFKRASVQSVQKVTLPPPVHVQPSEYVMVDEPESFSEDISNREEEAPPPPPPPRPTRRTSTHPPPVRAAPSAPAQMNTEERLESHDQWELPAIPTSSLGADLSASWSESVFDDNEQQESRPEKLQSHSPSAPLPIPPPFATAAPTSPEALHFDADELMAVWGRVGVQICEVATTMYDHSKKTLVGDGTYRGFINVVLSDVPNASKPHSKQIPFGYLVYLQNGGQVQKRASEILPGDIMEIVDAKFKGHKGLGTYTQHVGGGVEGGEGGGPVSGVVSEFEHKKSKVRVFQANQHVGQQTVEAVTYRLEDLKSGLVKVYRVLEAQ